MMELAFGNNLFIQIRIIVRDIETKARARGVYVWTLRISGWLNWE